MGQTFSLEFVYIICCRTQVSFPDRSHDGIHTVCFIWLSGHKRSINRPKTTQIDKNAFGRYIKFPELRTLETFLFCVNYGSSGLLASLKADVF
jgi:hypothetical protein